MIRAGTWLTEFVSKEAGVAVDSFEDESGSGELQALRQARVSATGGDARGFRVMKGRGDRRNTPDFQMKPEYLVKRSFVSLMCW